MADKPHFSAQDVADALIASSGIKTAAANKLGCHTATITRYIARYPTVAEAYNQSRDSIVDVAESILLGKLKAKEWDAAKFVLTTIGRDRGWGNSVDVNVKVDEVARQLAAEYGESEDRIRAELLDLETERKRRRTA